MMAIRIKRLDSGYLRAQGDGPCEWAQWPEDRLPRYEDFFPEASPVFRTALQQKLEREGQPQGETKPAEPRDPAGK